MDCRQRPGCRISKLRFAEIAKRSGVFKPNSLGLVGPCQPPYGAAGIGWPGERREKQVRSAHDPIGQLARAAVLKQYLRLSITVEVRDRRRVPVRTRIRG